jgi:hypothetical protein
MSMVEPPTAGQRDRGLQLPRAAAVTLRPPHRYNTP